MKKGANINKSDKSTEQVSDQRKKLKASPVGTLLYRAPRDAWSDNEIVVEADGSGGASLLIVEGNYPLDYLVHKEQAFSSEEDACDAADDMAD
jgi:hypothetical protein